MIVDSSTRLRILYVAFELPHPAATGSPRALYTDLAFLAARHQVKLACRFWARTPASHIQSLKEDVGCVDVIALNPEREGHWSRWSYLSDRVFRANMTSLNVQHLLVPFCRWAQIVQVENLEFAFNLLQALTAAGVEHRPAVVVRLHDVMSLLVAQEFAHPTSSDSLLRRIGPRVVLRAASARRVAQYKRLEDAVLRQADAVVVLSREDEAIVRAHHPAIRVHYIPMGLDLSTMHPDQKPPGNERQPLTLTFVGAFSWPPNADAAMLLVRDILPHLSDLDLRVRIVGPQPPVELRRYHDGRRVHVMGWVAGEDLETIWQETDIAVVPVRFGTGVKMKTLHALAHGIPVVTFPSGRRGVEGTSGVHFLEAPTIEEFAHCVRRLAADPALARKLSENGRRLVEREHTVAASGAHLEALYHELLEAGVHS